MATRTLEGKQVATRSIMQGGSEIVDLSTAEATALAGGGAAPAPLVAALNAAIANKALSQETIATVLLRVGP